MTGLAASMLGYPSDSPLNKVCAHLAHAILSSIKSDMHAQDRGPTAEVTRSAIRHSARLLSWQEWTGKHYR